MSTTSDGRLGVPGTRPRPERPGRRPETLRPVAPWRLIERFYAENGDPIRDLVRLCLSARSDIDLYGSPECARSEVRWERLYRRRPLTPVDRDCPEYWTITGPTLVWYHRSGGHLVEGRGPDCGAPHPTLPDARCELLAGHSCEQHRHDQEMTFVRWPEPDPWELRYYETFADLTNRVLGDIERAARERDSHLMERGRG